ncbi:uncharacterized protein [Rhodnius prolixus]|uniref:RING-type domain-containing protein n=1 Tax=Rhodnius prolixus TaxID=13249 RepID=T1HIP4_RHOPR
MDEANEIKSELPIIKQVFIFEDVQDINTEVRDNNPINDKKNELMSSNDVNVNSSFINNNDELVTLDRAIIGDHYQVQNRLDLEESERGSNNNNVNNHSDEDQLSCPTTEEINVENTNVYHTELTVEEQSTLNNNDSTDEVNQNSVEQVGELVNDMVSTLSDQRGREAVGLRRESYNVHRSRSPNNRIRSTSHRRCRRRRQRGATTHESPTERQPRAHDERDREVTYELITKETVPYEMSRTWRLVPKYKKLDAAEVAKQEADLYYSFLRERDPENVEPAGPDDRHCCACFENKATRIVAPCGHLCLCYKCAKTIAFYRTVLDSTRIQKKCPLCRAAISKIMRLL